jgi:hypothetical protein
VGPAASIAEPPDGVRRDAGHAALGDVVCAPADDEFGVGLRHEHVLLSLVSVGRGRLTRLDDDPVEPGLRTPQRLGRRTVVSQVRNRSSGRSPGRTIS